MVGIINCNKPRGITSFGVISKLRRILSVKKMGHSGTLDPEATGVLPVYIGKATKLIEYQNGLSKIYRGEMKLGIRTDTQDWTGQVIEEKEVLNIEEKRLLSLFSEFTGNVDQIPPMYSAVKHKGQKLYNLARKGIEVERKSRTINIKEIILKKYEPDDRVLFEVECSTGTYIRTLCEDIGLRLGCGAHLTSLIRLKSGSFLIKDSHTLEEIRDYFEANEIQRFLLPPSDSMKHFPSVVILPEFETFLLNGRRILIDQISNKLATLLPGSKVCIYNKQNELMAVSEVREDENVYFKPLKLLAR